MTKFIAQFFTFMALTYDEETKQAFLDMFERNKMLPRELSLTRELRDLDFPAPNHKPMELHDLAPVIRAMQSKYRPGNVTGQADIETCAILYALTDKYRQTRSKRKTPIRPWK